VEGFRERHRAICKPYQISDTKFNMGNKNGELHADFETVAKVPSKNCKKLLNCNTFLFYV
jgi:hypothetical protein